MYMYGINYIAQQNHKVKKQLLYTWQHLMHRSAWNKYCDYFHSASIPFSHNISRSPTSWLSFSPERNCEFNSFLPRKQHNGVNGIRKYLNLDRSICTCTKVKDIFLLLCNSSRREIARKDPARSVVQLLFLYCRSTIAAIKITLWKPWQLPCHSCLQLAYEEQERHQFWNWLKYLR